jgi:hypothetical protein
LGRPGKEALICIPPVEGRDDEEGGLLEELFWRLRAGSIITVILYHKLSSTNVVRITKLDRKAATNSTATGYGPVNAAKVEILKQQGVQQLTVTIYSCK